MKNHRTEIEEFDELPKLGKKRRPISETHPDLASRWYYKLNCGFGPDEISYGSGIKCWWSCTAIADHIFKATPASILWNGGTGCPYCTGQRVWHDNNFAFRYPDLAKEWMSDRNGFSPDEIVLGAHKKFYWQCSKDKSHVWLARADDRAINGSGCPKCQGDRIDLTDYPIVLEQFDYRKNKGIDPTRLRRRQKVWWHCPEGSDHKWFSVFTPDSKTKGKRRCPFCTNQKGSRLNNLTRIPLLKREFHKTKNGKLSPRDITLGSGRKIWWQCSKNPEHEWQEKVCSRVRRGRGCLICIKQNGNSISTAKISVHGAMGRKTTFISLASCEPEIAKQWHPHLNRPLTPQDVSRGSRKSIWWKCDKGPDHEWVAQVASRTGIDRCGCPCCRGRKVSITNSLASLYPRLASQWHPTKNADVMPANIPAHSERRVWWQCSVATDHEWESKILDRTRGRGCPFCAGKRPSKYNNLLQADPLTARQWHPTLNGSLTPSQVTPQSSKKVWWICPNNNNHVWESSVSTRRRTKSSCAICLKYIEPSRTLASRAPDLAKEWHPLKNTFAPNEISWKSKRKAWWQCAQKHEWQDTVVGRVVSKRNCIECDF